MKKALLITTLLVIMGYTQNRNGNRFIFYSPPVDMSGGYTSIYDTQTKKIVLINGYYQKNNIIDIAKNIKVLEVQTNSGGKLVKSTIYKFQDDDLAEISITPKVFSSGGIKFKDVDGDDISEMLVYHSSYSSDEKKAVEVYKYMDKIPSFTLVKK